MRKYSKIIALVLSLLMIAGAFFGCKDSGEIIGTVDGKVIPEGVFINNFVTVMNEESTSENWSKEIGEIYGKELYDALASKKNGDKTYFDTIYDKALEESRVFMIKQSLYSARDGWPDSEKQKELKENAASYIEQMVMYYGPSFGTEDKAEFVELACVG